MSVDSQSTTIRMPIPQPEADGPIAPDGPKAYKNIEMELMISTLEPLLERTDKIGYAAARNTRVLMSEAKEYFDRREQLVQKYGEMQSGEDGKPTGLVELRIGSPQFIEYAREIEEWALIEHTPRLFKLKYDEVIDKLSGKEILALDWMFED